MTHVQRHSQRLSVVLGLACVLVAASCGGGGDPASSDRPAVPPVPLPVAAAPAAPPVLAPDPGRVTMRRLNRAEYNNTVRDLLGTKRRPADDFPADDTGYGFDNIGDVLSLSPLLLGFYQQSAELLISEALAQAARARLVPCALGAGGDDNSCIDRTLRSFGRRAWRRPVTEPEALRLMTLAQSRPGDVESGLRLALCAMLVAPQFLFRIEFDPDPLSLTAHALDPYELASRLSYFLWSSTPDDELLEAAATGSLGTAAGTRAQVQRMLASPKARALVDVFAGQWLHLRKLEEHRVSGTFFPTYKTSLAASMRAETEALFAEVLAGRMGIDGLLTADFSVVDAPLAAHYGLAAQMGVARVALAGTPRGGLLTHGSVLMVTSLSTRTSPVLRGQWVLDQLLCQPAPAPPPGIEPLKDDTRPVTLRQRLEKHRADPVCASCHKLMDPIGLGLEKFDATGAFRELDNKVAIDATGELPDGRRFDGALPLQRLLAADPRFARCVVEHLHTFALGRGPDGRPDEDRLFDDLARGLAEARFDFAALVDLITAAPSFRLRRGEPDTKPDTKKEGS